MTDARPLPTVIGPTENALRALLTKILSTTRIRTYPAWVVLNGVSRSDPSDGEWRHAVADALKVGLDELDDLLVQLRDAGLLATDGMLTPLGKVELASARSAVSAATSRLVNGISDEDQSTARRVLDHVRREADDLLRR
jgi:hypothetical protein